MLAFKTLQERKVSYINTTKSKTKNRLFLEVLTRPSFLDCLDFKDNDPSCAHITRYIQKSNKN